MSGICGMIGSDGPPVRADSLDGCLHALRPFGSGEAGTWQGSAGGLTVALGPKRVERESGAAEPRCRRRAGARCGRRFGLSQRPDRRARARRLLHAVGRGTDPGCLRALGRGLPRAPQRRVRVRARRRPARRSPPGPRPARRPSDRAARATGNGVLRDDGAGTHRPSRSRTRPRPAARRGVAGVRHAERGDLRQRCFPAPSGARCLGRRQRSPPPPLLDA